MKKIFNTSADCKPELHYMVDISEKLSQIKTMVDAGKYFTINRARQYGKTTTLKALERLLSKEYQVVRLDFQRLGQADFAAEQTFVEAFSEELLETTNHLPDEIKVRLDAFAYDGSNKWRLRNLFRVLSKWCSIADKKIVLMIDEVDSASNNQIFLDFLAQLRNYYLERETKGTVTFQSVILAGVYDVKGLKGKIRPKDEQKTNSPWNIAADFDIDMSLSEAGIQGMLEEYEANHHTRMNIEEMSNLLFSYTSGYPYLVSRLCMLMDEKISIADVSGGKESAWTKKGFLEAMRLLLSESNTLFESMMGKLADYPDLDKMLGELLFAGKAITYNPTSQAIQLALMFGFIKNEEGKVVPANRIFDTLLYNHFLSVDELYSSDIYKASLQDKNQFIMNGHLNMRKILEKFVQHFHDLYGSCKERFMEEEGRRYFLLYLRPIINGKGNYYVEARTRTLGRTDIIIDYQGEQFVVEMKIWRGNEYNVRGEEQLAGYLDDYHLDIGYMVSFNFNQKKQVGVCEIIVGNKTLIEAVV